MTQRHGARSMPQRWWMPALVAWALTLAIAVPRAHAEPSFLGLPQSVTPVAPGVLSPKARWYGSQTLLCDAGAMLLTIGAVTSHAEFFGYSALGVYGLGGPVVHLVHRRYAVAGGSFALRLLAPTMMAFIGARYERCSQDQLLCGVGGAALGGLAGILTAIAVDAAVLAFDEEPSPRMNAETLPYIPALALGWQQERLTISLSGGF